MKYFYKSVFVILFVLKFSLLAVEDPPNVTTYYVESLNILMKNSNLSSTEIKELNNLILNGKSLKGSERYSDIEKKLLDKYINSIEKFEKHLMLSKSEILKILNAIVDRNGLNKNYVIKKNLPLKLNLNLSKDEAVKIAEIIMVKVYGEGVLLQRPWVISENGSGDVAIFLISSVAYFMKKSSWLVAKASENPHSRAISIKGSEQGENVMSVFPTSEKKFSP